MKIARSSIAAILAERSMQVYQPLEFGAEIAAYLLDEARTGELDSLMRDIIAYRAEHGIVEVTAITAFPLHSQTRKDVELEVRRVYPDAQQIIISEKHDQAVLGGVRLEFANQQLDLTVRAKLSRFKQLTTAERN